MSKFRVWFDIHALPHEQYEIVDAPDLETARAEHCNRPHYLYVEPDEIVARQAYAIARIEAHWAGHHFERSLNRNVKSREVAVRPSEACPRQKDG